MSLTLLPFRVPLSFKLYKARWGVTKREGISDIDVEATIGACRTVGEGWLAGVVPVPITAAFNAPKQLSPNTAAKNRPTAKVGSVLSGSLKSGFTLI